MKQFLFALFFVFLSTTAPSFAENGYDMEFVDLVEMVYGEGYLSQGGAGLFGPMFYRIDLEDKIILDIGCGVGGPALHLAKNYQASVVGIDPESFLIQRSRLSLEKLRKDATLKGTVSFEIMEDPFCLRQFQDNSFDIITSREVFLHIPHEHKLAFFQEIFRVLKPGGQLVIYDWCHKSANYSADVKEMMEMDGVPFYLTTPKQYELLLKQAQFLNPKFKNLTLLLANQTKQDLTIIEAKREQIIEKYGEEVYEYALRSWAIQGRAFEDRELLVGVLRASKKQ